MDASIETRLEAIEAAQAAMRTAVGDEDWEAVRLGDDTLRERMHELVAFVDECQDGLVSASLDALFERISALVATHDRLLATLQGSRAEAAAELGQARTGRRVVGRYLDAAGSDA